MQWGDAGGGGWTDSVMGIDEKKKKPWQPTLQVGIF
jgi:hypothetical protein